VYINIRKGLIKKNKKYTRTRHYQEKGKKQG